MANEPTIEQLRTQNYDYTLRWHFQRLWREIGKLLLIWLIIGAYVFYRSINPSFLGLHEIVTAFLGLMLGVVAFSFSLLLIQAIVVRLRDIYYQYRYKRIARQHPVELHDRIINAYNSAQPFLLNPRKAKWTPRRFRKMFRQYAEFEQLETDELKLRLENASVFDVNAKWYQKGQTIEDALMLAIYSIRLETEEVKKQATEKSLEQTDFRRQVMPDIHSRKDQELTKEAIEKELEKYTGQRTQSEPHELKTLDGQYVIHSINGEKARIVFTLASGEYIAELYDYRKKRQDAESFTVDQDGGAYVLKLNGRGFSEHTEITLINKESDAREEITLW